MPASDMRKTMILQRLGYHIRRLRFASLEPVQFAGPIFIIHGGHAGSRILAELMHRSGVQLGKINPENFDTDYFSPTGKVIGNLIRQVYAYPDIRVSHRQRGLVELNRYIREYVYKQIENPLRPFGWKFSASCAYAPLILELFPNARCIHLIRDGRDVVLSEMKARMKDLESNSINKILVFRDPDKKKFLGEKINSDHIREHRMAYEMQYWVSSVRLGRKAAVFPNQYLEIKFEDLLTEPQIALSQISTFTSIAEVNDQLDWLKSRADLSKIGRWKSIKDQDDFKEALAIGRPTLKATGYISSDSKDINL